MLPFRLSSYITIFQKVIVPVILNGAILSAIVIAIFRGRFSGSITGLLFLVFVQFLLSFMAYPLKQVYANDKGLIVSNYLKTIEIRYSEIYKIVPWWNRVPFITVVLYEPSPFGKCIVFIPKCSIPYFSAFNAEEFLQEKVQENQQ
jgi:hypothetical protein